jgi:hypothetical protein
MNNLYPREVWDNSNSTQIISAGSIAQEAWQEVYRRYSNLLPRIDARSAHCTPAPADPEFLMDFTRLCIYPRHRQIMRDLLHYVLDDAHDIKEGNHDQG